MPIKDHLENAKSIFDLLQRGIVVVALGVFLIVPSCVNDLLRQAGFTEGQFAGFKWKDRFEDTDQKLKDADATIESLKNKLTSANNRLASLNSNSATSEIVAANKEVLQAADNVLQSVQTTLVANESFVTEAQATTGSQSNNWGIIFGADSSRSDADAEVKRAKDNNFAAQLYNRQNYFRSVLEFPSREAASRELATVREKLRKDAYVVNLDKWCTAPLPPKDGVKVCSN